MPCALLQSTSNFCPHYLHLGAEHSKEVELEIRCLYEKKNAFMTHIEEENKIREVF